MFKKITVYLAVLALILGPSLVATSARADSDKGNKEQQKIEKKEAKQLNKLFKNWFKSEVTNDDSYDYKNDDRLPSGLRHAPGIEKRMESGKGLPFGWWKKLFGQNGTSTIPTFNLTLTNLSANTSTATATISWKTNRSSDSKLFYSLIAPATASSTMVSNGNLVTNHRLVLTGLNPNTTYYYFVTSTSNSGQTATSSSASFVTSPLPVADTEAPEITFNTIIGLTNTSARFIWVTNEASNSRVWVSTSTPVNLTLPSTNQNSSLTYYHDLIVNGLTASTTYYYVLSSADSVGNLATTTTVSFTTN